MIDTTAAWEWHHAAVKGFLRRRLANAEDVEDLLQETFLRLHRAGPALRDDNAERAWLLHTARNLVADHYRGVSAVQLSVAEVAAEETALPTPLQTLQPCIDPLAARLPEKYRQALALELEGMPQRQIAEHQGVGVSAAKSRVQRARRLLQREFERCCSFTRSDDGTLLDYRENACESGC